MIASQAWGFVEWFWNILTVSVGGIVTVIGAFIIVRMVEPKGVRALLRRLR